MIRILRSAAVALVAVGLVLGVMQAPASAATTVIVKLGARARLAADGKTATVKTTITCKNATPAPIAVRVGQNRGTVTVAGTGQSKTNYRCNGLSQHVAVKVAVNRGRFNPGGAHADAAVTVSGVSDTDSRDITLVS